MTADQAKDITLSSAAFNRKRLIIREILDFIYDRIHDTAMAGKTKFSVDFKKCYENSDGQSKLKTDINPIIVRDIIVDILKHDEFNAWIRHNDELCVSWHISREEYLANYTEDE